MKSFRLYLRPLVVVPQRRVGDYSKAERLKLFETYQASLDRYRKRNRNAMVVAIGIMACTLMAMVDTARWGIPMMWICPLGFFVLIAIKPWSLPTCPGCENDVDSAIGAYCPECGCETIQPGGWLSWPQCNSCERSLGAGKGGRHYRIRWCTHCGNKLSQDRL